MRVVAVACALFVVGGVAAAAVGRDGVQRVTRKAAFKGAPAPSADDRFVNCHATRLHDLVFDPPPSLKRARLPYTLAPEQGVQETNTTATVCYLSFVCDDFDKFMSWRRPSLAYPLYRSPLTQVKEMAVFGHSNGTHAAADALVWRAPADPRYADTLGYLLYPIAGFPYVVVRGKLSPGFNTRSPQTVERVQWKVLYSQLGDTDHVMTLQQGNFSLRRQSDNDSSVLLEGNNLVETSMHGFEDGWVAVVVRVTHEYANHDDAADDTGVLMVNDDIDFVFKEAADAAQYKNHTGEMKKTAEWWMAADQRRASSSSVSTPPPIAASQGALVSVEFNGTESAQTADATVRVVRVGDSCSPPKSPKYVQALVQGRLRQAMRFETATGIALTNIADVLNTGEHTTFTLVMMAKFDRTSCHVRLLNVNPDNDNGLYLCDGVQLMPEPPMGDPLNALQWYHIVISTDHTRRTKLYIDGVVEKDWQATRHAWNTGLRIDGDSLLLFNDCGSCACQSDENTGGWISHVELYNHVLEDSAVKELYAKFGNGLVADYDLSTGSVSSLVRGAPDLQDTSSACGKRNALVTSALTAVPSRVLRVERGTAVRIPGAAALVGKGLATEYTVVVKAAYDDVSCLSRFIHASASPNTGPYLCTHPRVLPLPRDGPGLHPLQPNHHHTLALSTRFDASTQTGRATLYVDGTSSRVWDGIAEDVWREALMVDGDTEGKNAFVLFGERESVCGAEGEAEGEGGVEDGSVGGELSRVRVYNRELGYDEVAQVVQAMGSEAVQQAALTGQLAGYVALPRTAIGAAADIAECRGGFVGCSAACNALFECTAFTLPASATGTETDVGTLKGHWSPEPSTTTDTYRKTSPAPVLDVDTSRQTLAPQFSLLRSLPEAAESGGHSTEVVDVAVEDAGCGKADGVFAEENLGKGYWRLNDEWVSLGTFSSSVDWSALCRSSAVSGINREWVLRVTSSFGTDFFKGKAVADQRATFCDALTSSTKHVWAPTEDGSFHTPQNYGNHYAGSSWHAFPPSPSSSYWGTFTAHVKWPSFEGTFPQHVFQFNRGTGVGVRPLSKILPVAEHTTLSVVMLVRVGLVGNGCYRVYNTAPSGSHGLFYCGGKLRLKATVGSQVQAEDGAHTIDQNRWYRIGLSTSPTRHTRVYLNEWKEIDATLSQEMWNLALKVSDDYLSLFNNKGTDLKCATNAGHTAGAIARVLVFDHVLSDDDMLRTMEMLRTKCPGETEECSGNGECAEGVCGCHREEPESRDRCTHQHAASGEAACNQRSACGDAAFCEFCDYCPVTDTCSMGTAMKCLSHEETELYVNKAPSAMDVTSRGCQPFNPAFGLSHSDYCAHLCATDSDCSSFHVSSSGTCCPVESFDDTHVVSVAGKFVTQQCVATFAYRERLTSAGAPGYPQPSSSNQRCGNGQGANDIASPMCTGAATDGTLALDEAVVQQRCSNDDSCAGYGRVEARDGVKFRPVTAVGGVQGSGAWKTFEKTKVTDLCTLLHGVREGGSAEERCLATAHCAFDHSTDLCYSEYPEVETPIGWKTHDCSVASCPGSDVECSGNGVCASTAALASAHGVTPGECACFQSSNKDLPQFRGVTPRFANNKCSVRQCPGSTAVSADAWSHCSGHGACSDCDGACVCDAGYRGSSPAGWGWDCSRKQCSGDRVVQASGNVKVVEVDGTDAKRVEVFVSVSGAPTQWGAVCSAGWSDADATVVCRALGMGTGKAVTVAGGVGPFFYTNCACGGSESDLSACCTAVTNQASCSHDSEAAVLCSNHDARERTFEECSGHGTCAQPGGTCVCDQYHRGRDLSVEGSDCSVRKCPGDTLVDNAWVPCSTHGTCDDRLKTCACETGWHGADCSLRDCPNMQFDAQGDPIYCSGRGSCNTNTGKCTCTKVGWGGAACDDTQWVNFNLVGGHADLSGSNPFYSKPRYRWFPEEQLCKFEGVVARNTATGSDSTIATLHSDHECRIQFGQNLIGLGSGGSGDYSESAPQRLDVFPDGNVVWRSKKDWVSLETVVYNPTSSNRHGVSLNSGFSNYNGGWEVPAYTPLPGGEACIVRGLMSHSRGNSNTHILTLPSNCRPSGRVIFLQLVYTTSGYQTMRVDVTSGGAVYVVAISGGLSWGDATHWLALDLVVPRGSGGALTRGAGVGNYNNGYLTAQAKTSTNLCFVSGLLTVSGRSTPTVISLAGHQCSPDDNHIVDVNQHGLRARLDINADGVYFSPGWTQKQSWLPISPIVLVKS